MAHKTETPGQRVPGVSVDDFRAGVLNVTDRDSEPDPKSNSEHGETCRGCGGVLPARRKLKAFCSYACKGRFRIAEIEGYRSGLTCSKNIKQRRALRSEKMRSVGRTAFCTVNAVTVRVDAPNKRGAGWLVEVLWPGARRAAWIARVGNSASTPLSLDAAKHAAIDMLKERGTANPRNWTRRLNLIAALEIERSAAFEGL